MHVPATFGAQRCLGFGRAAAPPRDASTPPPRNAIAAPDAPSPAAGKEHNVTHVDGFVAAVPTANKVAFRDHAEPATAAIQEHGALAVVERWCDDAPAGEVTSFPMAAQCKRDETVSFS